MKFLTAVLVMGLAAGMAMADEFEAEDQAPSGKFLTATEVRPILEATRGSWIAVREYGGQDLLYVTQILSWRCGLHRIRFGINGGGLQDWPMPPCYADEAAPNALKPDDTVYLGFGAGSIETVQIELLFDDLSTETAEFTRAAVQIQ